MFDQYKLHLQLLARIDGYNFVMKEPMQHFTNNNEILSTEAIQSFHSLNCQETVTKDSSYIGLAKNLDDSESETFLQQFDNFYEKMPTNKETLSDFINTNLSDITFWRSFSILREKNEIKNILTIFIQSFQNSVQKIISANDDLQVIYTPVQILDQILLLISKILCIIDKSIESHPNQATELKQFTKVLDKIKKLVSTSFQDPLFLFSINQTEILNYRMNISEFCFFSGFLDRGTDLKFSNIISQLLYFVDTLISYNDSLSKDPSTPIAVSRAANSCVQSLNSILSQEDILVLMNREKLSSLSALFEDISLTYNDTTCLKPVTTRLITFLADLQNDIESLLRPFLHGYSRIIHRFYVSYYQVIDFLMRLEFGNSNKCVVKTSSILSDRINVSKLLIETKEKIDSALMNPYKQYEIGEIALLFINPSRTTQSSSSNIISAPPEKILEQINDITLQINQLIKPNSRISPTIVPKFAVLSKKLLLLGKTVDSMKSENEELATEYFKAIDLLNNSVFSIIDHVCQPIDTMTPFSCVRSISFLIASTLKMLETVESSECDTKNDSKLLKDIHNDLDDLIKHFNAPHLIEKTAYFEQCMDTINTIIETNGNKYDETSRESYVVNMLNFAVTLITFITNLTKQMESRAYEMSEIFEDIDNADQNFQKSLSILSQEDTISPLPISLPTHYLLNVLAYHQGKTSMLRFALAVAIPQQLVMPIFEFRSSIDPLPELIFPFDPDHKSIQFDSITRLCSSALNSLSLARWKLCHLKEYYLYDQELKKVLNEITSNLNKAQDCISKDANLDKTAVETFKANNSSMLETIDNISSVLGQFNERTGEEPTDYIDIFKTLIHQVTETWDKELSKVGDFTLAMEGARQQLNEAIRLLHGDCVKYDDFINPMDQFGDSYLLPYLSASASKYGGDEFYKTAMDAKYIDFPSGNDKLKKGMEIMNSFINIITISPENIQQMMAAPLIYYISGAKLMAYRQYKEFLDLAIFFMEAPPHELNNLCFLLSYHMHKIYEKCAPNTIKPKGSIADLLRVNYMQHTNTKLADTYYYTIVFASLIPKEHAPIFNVLLEPMRACFHCHLQLSTVNFKEAIAYLNGIMPTQARFAEAKGIFAEQSKLEDEVNALREESKKRNKGKKTDDEDDIDMQGQEVIISRNVQVLKPKRNVTTMINTLQFNTLITKPITAKEKSQSTGLSAIINEDIDFDIGLQSERIYEPSNVEIIVPKDKQFMKKTWQTVIASYIEEWKQDDQIMSSKKPINRESHYKKIWFIKPMHKNNIAFNYNEIEKPAFEIEHPKVENEFNIPFEDLREKENTIQTNLVGQLIRKVSYSNAVPEFDILPICNSYHNKFVPSDIKHFPQNKEFTVPEQIPAALKKLKKAKEGEIVGIIKTDKSTREELLASLPFAVSRFLDVVSPANCETFSRFLGYFNKFELNDYLVPWIYHYFSPKHYPRHFLSRYFISLATYMRAVFLEKNGNDEMISAANSLPILIQIATVTILAYSAKRPGICVFSNTKQASAIYDFVDSVSFAISTLSSYDLVQDINHQMAIFLVATASNSYEDAFMRTLYIYLKNLSEFDVVTLIGNITASTKPPQLFLLEFQLDTLSYFCSQQEFVRALAYQKEQFFNPVYKNASIAFTENSQKAITQFIEVFAEIALIAESFSIESIFIQLNQSEEEEKDEMSKTELIASISAHFLKYIEVVLDNYQNDYIKYDNVKYEGFLVPFLLVLHSANKSSLIQEFNEMSIQHQMHFFTYLRIAMIQVLTNQDSPNPFQPLPYFNTRLDRLHYFRDKAENIGSVNYSMLTQITTRIADFMCNYVSENQLKSDVIDSAVQCIAGLFNLHQLTTNHATILYLLVRFISKHALIFYTTDTNWISYSHIINTAYDLVTHELQIARSCGVALLVHLLYCEYMETYDLYLTEYCIMKTHQQYILPELDFVNNNPLELYHNLLIQLELYLVNFSITNFVEKADLVIEKLNKIHKMIKERYLLKPSQLYQYESLSKIADEFNEIPSLRLDWLERIAKYNLEKKLYQQAFMAQSRAVALITNVLKALGKYDDLPISVDSCFEENVAYANEMKRSITTHMKEHTGPHTTYRIESTESLIGSAIQLNENVNDTTDSVLINTEIDNNEKVKDDKKVDVRIVYLKNDKFTYEYLISAILAAFQMAFNGSLMKQYTQIANNITILSLNEIGVVITPFENIQTIPYYYLYGERSKGKTTVMKIFSTTIPTLDEFAEAAQDDNSEYCVALKHFILNKYQSIVEAENALNNGRFVIPVQCEHFISFDGESRSFFSDYLADADKDDDWTEISVTRTYFKTAVPIPDECICVNARKSVIRQVSRKNLLQLDVWSALALLSSARTATRAFKGNVGITPLEYAIKRVIVDENCCATELIDNYNRHILDEEVLKLAKSFIQDTAETMNLYAEKVRNSPKAKEAIDVYNELFAATQGTARNLRVTDYHMIPL